MPIITITAEAHQLLKDALKELEAPKGSVQAGVQKLLRAARMLGDEDVAIWCEIQLGNAKYVAPLASAVKSDSLMYALISRDIRKRIQKLPKAPTKPTKQEKTKTERSRSEEHTSELQSPCNLVCRLLLEKKKKQ